VAQVNATPPSAGAEPIASDGQTESEAYLTDISRMLEYCRSRGIAIPDEVRKSVVEFVSYNDSQKGLKNPNLRLPLTSSDYDDLIKTHGKLSELIFPATPLSLCATDFSFRQTASIKTMALLVLLVAAAVVGLFGYFRTLSLLSSLAKPDTRVEQQPNLSDKRANQ